jgi:protein-L-isoaspartate(D-aspartate) O-methyltransferase
MSWRCSASSNGALVANLVSAKLLTNSLAISAMKYVDRSLFVFPELISSAYDDNPLPIGFNVTISAPHMHARMLDLMAPHLGPGTSALDVGSGSGYIVACIAKMGAMAYGIEHISQLVPRSIAAVRKVLTDDQFQITEGDGRNGWPEHAPFDVIHVGAAAQPEVVPALMAQLKPHGILIIPVEEKRHQALWAFSFGEDGSVVKQYITGVVFVPLCDKPR